MHGAIGHTRVSNSFLQDGRLGFDTRGMILHLLSLPDDTEITFELILQGSPAGRDKCYRMLREAQEHGYVRLLRVMDDRLKMSKSLYLVSDHPEAIIEPIQVRASDFYARSRIPLAVRRAVYERDGFACLECGARSRLSLDHVIPVSSGGDDSPENLRTLCLPCNVAKGGLAGEGCL